MKILKTVTGLAAAAAVSLFALSAAAQNYPERNITMVVPFAAGGPTDTVARLVAESMSKDLGQQIIVENVGGAGGTLGAGRVASSDPDGYTVLLHHIGMATSATLYRKLAYDTLNAFEYVGLVTEVPMTILSRKTLETKDLKGLIEYAKANKDKVTVANAGIGAASHLCGMLFMSAIETPLVTVPYKGTGPAMTDLLGGQVDIMCDQTTNTTKQIQGGTVKAYAVTTAKRLDVLPDVPTVVEAGLPKLEVGIWHGIYTPKGTPAEINEKLSKSLQVALKDKNVAARFAELGTTPSSESDATPAALKAKLESEIARWKPVIEAAGQYAD
ncbi:MULTISPECIES: tripartite tricarboxylate transporter substrate-binding protein [Agrobacterium tumefaciens complex]|uniref:tripartite tricarboxylate transporter substrate-binding protein n=1 Tax=Agrobacterium tumefaciens complex TaxID=1183400 RepID=UPI000DDB3D0F|nr:MULTISPECIES: tripartite tricarboxylate transporter substrate-binding protein [Agrobacterium tumefaciens complex]MBB4404462.1 tripartite-type tricarboxylate transporter receptor subunit TctC [Agrobacterium radiobacter]MBB4452131.1 tripartite-type tricarboxylate transporter receptor subunit TctC [Agrobacterium radiobacter]MDR6588671.1 tripartite-type tricarboxylate transporter receptor subunit TctC [Agrobacterium tumefaciens]